VSPRKRIDGRLKRRDPEKGEIGTLPTYQKGALDVNCIEKLERGRLRAVRQGTGPKRRGGKSPS